MFFPLNIFSFNVFPTLYSPHSNLSSRIHLVELADYMLEYTVDSTVNYIGNYMVDYLVNDTVE